MGSQEDLIKNELGHNLFTFAKTFKVENFKYLLQINNISDF